MDTLFVFFSSSDIDPTIQESFKSAMASINSFASSPYTVPSLDEEFDKNCVVFKHPDPLSNGKQLLFHIWLFCYVTLVINYRCK